MGAYDLDLQHFGWPLLIFLGLVLVETVFCVQLHVLLSQDLYKSNYVHLEEEISKTKVSLGQGRA